MQLMQTNPSGIKCEITAKIRKITMKMDTKFYSVLLWRLISARQTLRHYTKIQLKNRLSIAIAKITK